MKSIFKQLAVLHKQLQNGTQVDEIIKSLQVLKENHPQQAEIHHLLGLAYKKKGKLNEALIALQTALKFSKNNIEVLNTLANLYVDLQQFDDAESHYQQAIQLSAAAIEPKKNLALLYFQQHQYNKAISLLKSALKYNPKDLNVLTQLGNNYRELHQYPTAIEYYQQALKINPNYVTALHNLGLTYKLTEQLEFAVACYKRASQLAANISEIDYNLANAYFEQGKLNLSEQLYWQAINKSPFNIEYHQTLNELYWQQNSQQFNQSYQQVLTAYPQQNQLRVSQIALLLNAKQIEQAQQCLTQAFKYQVSAEVWHLQAKVFALRKQTNEAVNAFEQALKLPHELAVELDFIEFLIIEQDYQRAQQLVDSAKQQAPLNQLLWAYQGTLWQLTQNEQFSWLLDYQQFIGVYDIPVPNGYSNRDEFLAEFQQLLLSMHNMQKEPLKQTLKNGTQTPGRLFYKPHPVITQVRNAFAEITRDFVSKLASDNRHPLLSRKATEFDFSGSWSVKLKPNGYHINHVHPEGWLSSCFYVSVPKFDDFPQQTENAGAIKFGESSMQLGKLERIGRLVNPKSGLVAIFPSYMWHGTIPFNGDASSYRLTAPCDIVPLSS